MQHAIGTIWQGECDGRVIPINGSVTGQAGEMILNSPEAQFLCWRWPSFAWQMQMHYARQGLHVQAYKPFQAISFPVRYDARSEKVSLTLLERSTLELVDLAEERSWQRVLLPLEGLTGGERELEPEVISILEQWLSNAFVLMRGEGRSKKVLKATGVEQIG